jgi:hypothetical protein
MIYKFRSRATGDVIMLGPHGDHFLSVLGREPSTQGIIEVAAMPDALKRIDAAIAADEAARQQPAAEDDGASAEPVGLRQRLWPMVEMLREAQAADEPIVWGV